MFDDFHAFIQTNPDARELKRAIAVRMFFNGYQHREIGDGLEVSSGCISKWTKRHEESGVPGLRLGYVGSVGYLSAEQRQEVRLFWVCG